MAARTERDTLNMLIETCRDGARGYQLAADHVASANLKEFFVDGARQRDRFAAELLPYAQRLGGRQDAEGTAAGTLHRGWMMLKDALTNYSEDAVLAEAERGEAVAAEAYANAVMGVLPPEARPVIDAQYAAIRDSQRQLDELRLSRLAS